MFQEKRILEYIKFEKIVLNFPPKGMDREWGEGQEWDETTYTLFFKLKVLFSCNVFLRHPSKVSGLELSEEIKESNQEFSSDRLCLTKNSSCRQSQPTGWLSSAGTRGAEYYSLCLQHKHKQNIKSVLKNYQGKNGV